MFKPSKIHHSHCKSACKAHISDSFGLLCWNVYKKNRTDDGFEAFIQKHFGESVDFFLVNIHAINFRENSAFGREKERLLEFLSAYEGALVIAGDFNTWNRNRMEKLTAFRERLALEQVPFGDSVKSIFGNPIDFIFYRGLELLESKVVDDHGISDHHPLFAWFRKI